MTNLIVISGAIDNNGIEPYAADKINNIFVPGKKDRRQFVQLPFLGSGNSQFRWAVFFRRARFHFHKNQSAFFAGNDINISTFSTPVGK